MLEFFADWRPGQVIGLVSVLAGSLMITIIALASLWLSARNSTLLADQKREYLERGLSIEQIEQLLRSPAESAAPIEKLEAEANLASILVANEVPAAGLQQVMEMFQSVDASAKPALAAAIESILESGADEAQLLAAVRALCGPRAPKQFAGVA